MHFVLSAVPAEMNEKSPRDRSLLRPSAETTQLSRSPLPNQRNQHNQWSNPPKVAPSSHPKFQLRPPSLSLESPASGAAEWRLVNPARTER